jgi:hypothetical protein
MKNFFSFCVLVITVLVVNLLTGYITDYLMNYKGITNPLKFTAIGMGILVIILSPAFKFLDEMVSTLAKKVMSKGHHMFGKILGTVMVFSMLLFILYCIYAKQWYGINVPKILLNRWL